MINFDKMDDEERQKISHTHTSTHSFTHRANEIYKKKKKQLHAAHTEM